MTVNVTGIQPFQTYQPKDPNIALSPGVLSFECTPAEMKNWSENFLNYFYDCTDMSSKKAIGYLRHFMDSDYRKSGVEVKFLKEKTVEENLRVLEEEKKVRYPLILRRLRLFEKDEPIMSFINRVHEDSDHADLGSITKEDLILMIIVGKCGVPDLQKCWSMNKELNMDTIMLDAEAHTQYNNLMTGVREKDVKVSQVTSRSNRGGR